ncbi:GNAT family N-acetyltransferase [Paenibacillus sp. 481]|uniref:GNAT family N-acetyltransferase n=1 Tax=Paenibacillus sp. 481 TaxID=2835869 RepID=UPI001E4279CA|nr:GNAT family N-acetyltransferase [Paenibacillus sp. 481]UHA73684.1 GNAT family N-acetyltransferase [Paenibacillus sp. 481]
MVTINKVEIDQLLELKALYEQLVENDTNLNKMTETYKLMLQNPHYYVLGAQIEDQLVGTVMGIICYDLIGDCLPFMVVENVVVSDKHQGAGIGKKLMNAIEEIANEHHCSYIIFVSSGFRTDAHKFYESLGYCKEPVKGFRKQLNGGVVPKQTS